MLLERRRLASAAAGAALLGAATAAVWVDLSRGMSPSDTEYDIAVGAAFVLAAALSPPPARQRVRLGAVAGLWWLASISPSLLAWAYAALLAELLLAFPDGRLGRRRTRIAAAVAVLLCPFGGLTAAFLVVAVERSLDLRSPAGWRAYPVLAAVAIALSRGMVWVADVIPSVLVVPGFWERLYEVVLVLVAFLHIVSARRAVADRAASVVGLLERPGRAPGLDQLADALRDVLGDPDLRVLRWDAVSAAYVDASGHPHEPREGWIEIHDGEPVAAVLSGSALLTDPVAAAQVADAVRLTVRAQHRQAGRESEVASLEAARRRLLEAADAQRVFVAERLTTEVLPHLASAQHEIAELTASEELDIVRDQLRESEADLRSLVDGVPPAGLGHGRLAAALESLALRSGLPVQVSTDPGWAAGRTIEQTLYYVASEALANVLKHARATQAWIRLTSSADSVVLDVEDDGVGGADPLGLGLVGLAERVADRGGTLTVVSPEGGGTTLSARLPR